MNFSERITQKLESNKIQEALSEFQKFLADCPPSNTDAKADANQLRSQIIVLSQRYNSLRGEKNTNTVTDERADIEEATLTKSIVDILNQIPINYTALNTYMEDTDEDDAWHEAENRNKIEAYNAYFRKYPNGKYKADTEKIIAKMESVRQKQDEDIKKLAQLEKEKRDRDKEKMEAEEEEKKQAAPVFQQAAPQSFKSAPPPTTAESSPSFFKSKAGMGIIAAVVILIIYLIIPKGNSADEGEDLQAGTEVAPPAAPADAYAIDVNAFYFIENRENGKILAVINGSEADDAELIVTDTIGKMNKYFEKFSFAPATGAGQYIIYAAHSGKVLELRSDDIIHQYPKDEDPLWQIFRFTPFNEGYFIIGTKDQGKVLGLDPATKDDPEGQAVKQMDHDESPQTQWRLIPTGEKLGDPQ